MDPPVGYKSLICNLKLDKSQGDDHWQERSGKEKQKPQDSFPQRLSHVVEVDNGSACLHKPNHSGQGGDHTEALDDDQTSKKVRADIMKPQAEEYKQKEIFDLIKQEEENFEKW